MASSFIPIFNSLDLEAIPVNYYSLGWQGYAQNLRGFIVSDLTYEFIKKNDVIIIELSSSPTEKQIALYKDSEGKPIIAQGPQPDLQLVGVIRHVCAAT
jgi:hypothetical protein